MRHVVRSIATLSVVATLGSALPAAAQEPAAAGAVFVVADTGHATTWDDEGLLGRGVPLSAGVGVALTPGLRLLGFVERLPYERDITYLRFDGRIFVYGVEATWHFRERGVRPFIGGGIGVLDNDGIWIRRTTQVPFGPTTEEEIDLGDVLTTLFFSAGVEIPVHRRISIRPSFRMYAPQANDDFDPWMVVRPGVGVSIALGR